MILATAQTANPSEGPDPELVTPGTIGFLATLVIVIFVIFLIRDALRRVRRVRARAHADDAYPIPMRKYAVPNQSKLSGETAPKSAADAEEQTEPAETEPGRAESSEVDPPEADPEHTDQAQADPARRQD
ncbi:hypothetical protein [Brevibacterium sandarakinum]|uniref:hypothetical protein n=1 Tax=Brevibacterium sandarakinum TaxID=629680 RepID=UPI00264A56C7|nr:hypothetical protein [Brevibacterium sandarakinum]MDN5656835.1 hypothetical protein [Brevibacterium sandarakinum]